MSSRMRTLLILGVLTLCAALFRFTAIITPDVLAGDEQYFVTFSREFQQHQFFFDVHPPLGKMIIATGMWFFGDTPFGWRFMSALFGTALIPILYFFGSAVTQRKSIGMVLALLGVMDGLFFVLSRVAVMDIFLLDFLLLGYIALFRAIHKKAERRTSWLRFAAAGMFFGLACSVKWIGLVFLLAVPLLLLTPELIGTSHNNRMWQLRRLGIVLGSAGAVYLVVWGVHLLWLGFAWGELPRVAAILHIRIFSYHSGIAEPHAYGSPWWSWPFLWRPWEYFVAQDHGAIRRIIALGNPLLWWSAVVAFVVLSIHWIKKERWIPLTLLLLCIHWVPFALVRRPMFTYHFVITLPILLVPLAAGMVYGWGKGRMQRVTVAAVFLLFLLSAWWLLPLWMGTALSAEHYQARMWLPTWDIQQ